MELSRLQKNAQVLFNDRCDIKRYRFDKSENGISNAVLYDIYNDVMCRISYLTSEPNEELLLHLKQSLKLKYSSLLNIKLKAVTYLLFTETVKARVLRQRLKAGFIHSTKKLRPLYMTEIRKGVKSLWKKTLQTALRLLYIMNLVMNTIFIPKALNKV